MCPGDCKIPWVETAGIIFWKLASLPAIVFGSGIVAGKRGKKARKGIRRKSGARCPRSPGTACTSGGIQHFVRGGETAVVYGKLAPTLQALTPRPKLQRRSPMSLNFRRSAAEFLGTFWLVFRRFAAAPFWRPSFRESASAWSAFRLAFWIDCADDGLCNRTYSGCHLNPAVGRFGYFKPERGCQPSDLVPYIVAQVLGGIAGSAVRYCDRRVATVRLVLGRRILRRNGYDLHSAGATIH